MTVSTASGCAWTATSGGSSWLSLGTTTSGSGSGTVSWVAAPSSATSPRSATLTIAGQSVVITQAAAAASCAYAIAPESASIGPDATTITVAVTTQPGCAWTVKQVDPWLEIGGAASGSGSGTAQVDVQKYKGNAQRTGTMTIAGKTFTVTQSKSK